MLAEAALRSLSEKPRYISVTRRDVPPAILAAFPGYRGPKFTIIVTDHVTFHDLFWGDGSRNEYVAVRLADGQTSRLAPGISPWRTTVAEGTTTDIPPGFAVVEHTIFQGKDLGLRVHVHPADVAPLLPASTSSPLTEREQGILRTFRSYTSAYRKEELARMGVTAGEVDALVARGLLSRNRAGATSITREGRNSLGSLADSRPGYRLAVAGWRVIEQVPSGEWRHAMDAMGFYKTKEEADEVARLLRERYDRHGHFRSFDVEFVSDTRG